MRDPMLIPADLLARLSTLRLRSRFTSAGQGIGQHASRSRGAGLEFAQYRAYEPGDEPRRVDWKLYARSDRFFVRDAERDSPLTVWVVLDTSASMSPAPIGKHDESGDRLAAARVLAACIFELALKQNDAFGLAMLGESRLSLIDAATGRRHHDRLFHDLARQAAHGGAAEATVLRPIWEATVPGDLVVVLSDGFDEQTIALAERLSAARRDVAFIRLLTAQERDFPFQGGPRFRDPESGAEIRVDAPRARAEFLQRFSAARAALLQRLQSAGVRTSEAYVDEPLDRPLRRLFGARETA